MWSKIRHKMHICCWKWRDGQTGFAMPATEVVVFITAGAKHLTAARWNLILAWTDHCGVLFHVVTVYDIFMSPEYCVCKSDISHCFMCYSWHILVMSCRCANFVIWTWPQKQICRHCLNKQKNEVLSKSGWALTSASASSSASASKVCPWPRPRRFVLGLGLRDLSSASRIRPHVTSLTFPQHRLAWEFVALSLTWRQCVVLITGTRNFDTGVHPGPVICISSPGSSCFFKCLCHTAAVRFSCAFSQQPLFTHVVQV